MKRISLTPEQYEVLAGLRENARRAEATLNNITSALGIAQLGVEAANGGYLSSARIYALGSEGAPDVRNFAKIELDRDSEGYCLQLLPEAKEKK